MPEKERLYGLTQEEHMLAARVGNDIVPEYASDPVTAANNRETIVENHPEWDALARAAVRAGEIAPGMSRAQATAAWGPGFCRQIRPVKYANRVRRERHWFDCSPQIAALYFVDDTLIAARLYDENGQSIPMALGPSGLGYTRPVRSLPKDDPQKRFERAQGIYPDWGKPMRERPVASDIP